MRIAKPELSLRNGRRFTQQRQPMVASQPWHRDSRITESRLRRLMRSAAPAHGAERPSLRIALRHERAAEQLAWSRR
jgi:hypothetical protein